MDSVGMTRFLSLKMPSKALTQALLFVMACTACSDRADFEEAGVFLFFDFCVLCKRASLSLDHCIFRLCQGYLQIALDNTVLPECLSYPIHVYIARTAADYQLHLVDASSGTHSLCIAPSTL